MDIRVPDYATARKKQTVHLTGASMMPNLFAVTSHTMAFITVDGNNLECPHSTAEQAKTGRPGDSSSSRSGKAARE